MHAIIAQAYPKEQGQQRKSSLQWWQQCYNSGDYINLFNSARILSKNLGVQNSSVTKGPKKQQPRLDIIILWCSGEYLPKGAHYSCGNMTPART
jgi:hypothetical protein